MIEWSADCCSIWVDYASADEQTSREDHHIGTVLLLAAWRGLRGETPSVSPRFVEAAGVYWHMVDLLWVVLFPLLYISRQA